MSGVIGFGPLVHWQGADPDYAGTGTGMLGGNPNGLGNQMILQAP